MTDEERAYRDAHNELLTRARCVSYYAEAVQSPYFKGALPADFVGAIVKLNDAFTANDDAYVVWIDSLVTVARTPPQANRQYASQGGDLA